MDFIRIGESELSNEIVSDIHLHNQMFQVGKLEQYRCMNIIFNVQHM